ncbi:MAG: hypothetical protein M0P00_00405 [Bacteroidaceae bacterium]|nr:hypothetical protein [Bacteroidaceae bacterium]
MKLGTVVKLMLGSLVLLLMVGFAFYSYYMISVVSNKKDFNFFSLVPSSAVAVVEVDNVNQMINELGELDSSKENNYLYFSKLFTFLKNNFYNIESRVSNGSSSQLNSMLISFHAPGTTNDQIFYFKLGAHDHNLIKSFFDKNIPASYAKKILKYKGEKIDVYALSNGEFLACYQTSNFVVLSFQARLIEEVIDVCHSPNEALLYNAPFKKIYDSRKSTATAKIYAHMQSVDLGDSIHSNIKLSSWGKFELRLNGRFIYLNGTSCSDCSETDTDQSFANFLLKEQSLKVFPGLLLPDSTYSFTQFSVNNVASLLQLMTGKLYGDEYHDKESDAKNSDLSVFLKDNGVGVMTTCFFHRMDTIMYKGPCSLMSFSFRYSSDAENKFANIVLNEKLSEGDSPISCVTQFSIEDVSYPLFVLHGSTLYTDFTGVILPEKNLYATFYMNRLLLAPDIGCLNEYISHLNSGTVLKGTPDFELCTGKLADGYNFLLMYNFSDVFAQPQNYNCLVPSFFFKYAYFFKAFLLSVQNTCVGDSMNLNLVLTYKTKK